MEERLRHPILVADDDDATRVLLQRQLEGAGYEVTACADGHTAFAAVQQLGPCIVLADWAMPGMDGLELCRAVRSLAEMQAISGVHVILLTAHTAKDDVVRGLEAGADEYLTKPWHERELLARIRAGERILALQEELIARQIQVSKINAEMAVLNRKLSELANTDALTGLWNRRRTLDRLSELWELAGRRGHALGVVMIDVDRFKSVNDTHGHKAGDAVLAAVAAAIRRTVRRYDVCGRMGGEEFIVLTPDTAMPGPAVLAERLRATIERLDVPAGAVTLRVTISAGAAGKREAHRSVEDLLSEADELLYAAKQNGRNQVWLADACGARGRFAPEPAAV